METSVKTNRSKQQQATHTPGPWVQTTNHDGSEEHISAADHEAIASAVNANRKANARLIAAAPELLAVAHDFVALVDESPRDKAGNRAFIDVRSFEAFGSRARAAIAKAEGR